jgi:alpha-ribazole phosphatase
MDGDFTLLDCLRHGEPVGGRRYRGQSDDPLSDRGWAQMRAATAGERPWQAIVTSPMARCRAFAQWLAEDAALPLEVDARLREVGFGDWEGRTPEELKRQDPDQVFEFKRDPVGRRPAGAERLHDFHRRVREGYEDLLDRHRGGHVLVVAHAGVIRMAICHALGLPPEHAYRINVAAAGMARFRIETKGERRLDTLLSLG